MKLFLLLAVLRIGNGQECSVEVRTKLFKTKEACVNQQIKAQLSDPSLKLMCIEHEVHSK